MILLNTEEVIVSMLRESLLTVEEADGIKFDWETKHRFKLMFGSFSEKI